MFIKSTHRLVGNEAKPPMEWENVSEHASKIIHRESSEASIGRPTHKHPEYMISLASRVAFCPSTRMEGEEPHIGKQSNLEITDSTKTYSSPTITDRTPSHPPSLFTHDDADEKERSKRKKDFPWKLHQMLEEAERDGNESIVSWDDDGTRFKVHEPERFVKEIMPRYFKQTMFRSFQRMLNLYNFEKLVAGPYRGGYSHSNFCRDKRELCLDMRIRPKAAPRADRVGKKSSNGKIHTADSINTSRHKEEPIEPLHFMDNVNSLPSLQNSSWAAPTPLGTNASSSWTDLNNLNITEVDNNVCNSENYFTKMSTAMSDFGGVHGSVLQGQSKHNFLPRSIADSLPTSSSANFPIHAALQESSNPINAADYFETFRLPSEAKQTLSEKAASRMRTELDLADICHEDIKHIDHGTLSFPQHAEQQSSFASNSRDHSAVAWPLDMAELLFTPNAKSDRFDATNQVSLRQLRSEQEGPNTFSSAIYEPLSDDLEPTPLPP